MVRIPTANTSTNELHREREKPLLTAFGTEPVSTSTSLYQKRCNRFFSSSVFQVIWGCVWVINEIVTHFWQCNLSDVLNRTFKQPEDPRVF